jgi:hypothetical protein
VLKGSKIVLDFHVIDSWNDEVGTKSEDGILSEYGTPKTWPKELGDRVSTEIEKLDCSGSIACSFFDINRRIDFFCTGHR